MTDLPLGASGWTKRAIEEISVGEASDARQMLAAALQVDSRYEPAWLWFATLSTSDGERRYCYQQALAINPESPVGPALAKLPPTPAILPPELSDFADPPIPEEFGGDHIDLDRHYHLPKWAQLALGLALSLLLGGLLGWFLLDWQEGNETITIAFASDFAGSGEVYSREMEQALLLYFDIINGRGGVNGRDIELIVFDDGGTPEGAIQAAEQIVLDDRIVAVIGHRTSTLSIAAAPVYDAAGIPVLTGTSTSDELTAQSEWYFRTIFDNSAQGAFMASYVHSVLDKDQAILIVEDNSFGNSLGSNFISDFESIGGEVVEQITVQSDVSGDSQDLAELLALIADQNENVAIVVAANAQASTVVIDAIRMAGLERTIIGSDAVASSTFLSGLTQLPDDSQEAASDSFLYSVSPLITDSLTGDMLNAYRLYFDRYGETPTWRGLSTVDAGVAIVRTLATFNATGKPDQIESERNALRDGLASVDSPEKAVPGLLGPIYFDVNRTVPRSMVMGIAAGDDFITAPQQLRLIKGDTESLERMGADLVTVADRTYVQSRVVYTGIEVNEIRDLNSTERTFFADFYLWFKYVGDDDVTEVIFPNRADVEQFTFIPVRTDEVNGLNYSLFRITGIFKTDLDFHDFPFDQQVLQIKVQNSSLSSIDAIYAVDRDFRQVPMEQRLLSGANSGASILRVPNWTATSLEMVQLSLGTTSNLGDSTLGQTTTGFEFSQILIGTGIEREVTQFLIKNILPLALIALITYISLFFSHDQTTERVSFGITGVLTGAVLLSGISGLLPDVGYTVAIEWAYYVFIILSGLCILVALIGGRLNANRQFTEMRTLDRVAQIGYPLAVAATVFVYYSKFG